MLRRLILLTVVASCLGSLTPARAQDNPWSGEPGRFVPWDGNGAWEPWGGYPPMATPYGSAPSPYSAPPPALPPNAPLYNQGPYPHPQSIYEFQPPGDVRGPFFESSPGGQRLQAALQQTFVRIDYLNWNLTDPGERLVGAEWLNANARDITRQPGNTERFSASVIPLARNRDGTIRFVPDDPFPPTTGPVPATVLPQAVDLSPFDLKNRNGMRFTVGVPVDNGSLEFNIWGLQKVSESFRVEPDFTRLGTTNFYIYPAIPLTNNGQLVDPTLDAVAPMILFDDFMHVQFGTELYGADLNYFRKLIHEQDSMRLELMAGGRFIRLREDMFITGHDQQMQVSPQILAVSSNHIFGPSVGLRLELEKWIFKVGADTRVTAAFNRHNNLVRTADLFPQNRTPTQSDDDHTDFAPVHELQVYGQVKLTHRLKVRVGYNLLNMFRISRPQNNVIWDDSGIADGPVRIRMGENDLETFNASGLFVSGEWSLF